MNAIVLPYSVDLAQAAMVLCFGTGAVLVGLTSQSESKYQYIQETSITHILSVQCIEYTV